MVDSLIRALRLASTTLVRHQILFSAALSTAAGIILRALVLIPVGNPLFQYMAVQRPDLYRAFVGSFAIFLFTTPYLVLSMCFSLVLCFARIKSAFEMNSMQRGNVTL